MIQVDSLWHCCGENAEPLVVSYGWLCNESIRKQRPEPQEYGTIAFNAALVVNLSWVSELEHESTGYPTTLARRAENLFTWQRVEAIGNTSFKVNALRVAS